MSRCDLKEPGKDLFRQGVSDAELSSTNRSFSIGTCAIGTAPDEVLLDIFDFYRQDVMCSPYSWAGNWRWHTLVHVCRRWRHIVLTSSGRLDLRLLCTVGRPVTKYLDCWPPTLPIAILYNFPQFSSPHPEDERDVLTALENPDRVCSIELFASNELLAKVSRVMQVPFPALKNLSLRPMNPFTPAPIVSEGFLGGSAPGLQKFSFSGEPPSALPNFLLSCRGLVDLQLLCVPYPDQFLPELIVTTLSNLSRLKILNIGLNGFLTFTPRRSHLPRLTFSALSEFTFTGSGEYLEDLLARIDTPFIQRIDIRFHRPLSDAPQLCQFIFRTEGLRSQNQATIKRGRSINLMFRQAGRSTGSPMVRYPPITTKNCNISLLVEDWQASVIQFCLQLTPLLSGVKWLTVESTAEQALPQEVVGPADWLDLFRPFSAVEELYVGRLLGSPVALSLAGATGQAEMLPALRSVFFQDAKEFALVEETIKSFFAARRLSHYHVSVFSFDQF